MRVFARRFGACLALILTAAVAARCTPAGTDRAATLSSGGYARHYWVHVPGSYRSGTPMPLVLVLHGAGGTGRDAAIRYNWEREADARGFVCVAPDGVPSWPQAPPNLVTNPRIWRDGRPEIRSTQVDDVAFVRALLDRVERDYSIDRRRVYVAGFSNGAGMTFRLGAEMADRITAIGAAASYCPVAIDRLARPVPLFYVTGTGDPLNPLSGGAIRLPWGTTTTKPPIDQTIGLWARLIGAPAAPSSDTRDGIVRRRVYRGAAGAVVVYVTIDGMGHHWSGSREVLPRSVVGNSIDPIDETDEMWRFFARYALPGTAVSAL